uniref:Putative secreted protein n=1 Tax=Panstrongylus lignarius TaxID=156445 RepID=A0A224Y171_9HEMI
MHCLFLSVPLVGVICFCLLHWRSVEGFCFLHLGSTNWLTDRKLAVCDFGWANFFSSCLSFLSHLLKGSEGVVVPRARSPTSVGNVEGIIRGLSSGKSDLLGDQE